MMTGPYYNLLLGGFMSTYKETVTTRNNERKNVYSQLIAAIEKKDESTVDKMILKLGIYASRPVDIGFSIHDLKTFLKLTETAIETYSFKADYRSKKLFKVNNRIAKSNGVNVRRADKIARNDEHFWLGIYKTKLNARIRVKNIIMEQLNKRNYVVITPVYHNEDVAVHA